ncbi:apolipoprotein A-IV isoform X2 [Anguilla anguilla]|uniref:apolipoprotein A-IV isoform X2 n=1 Tax=Anguilla anguilla TaxID=7936 RepID=UPI0015A98DF3|nr:apolipoprotein A-IV isoform X2 [Anguilla anguilla]
MHLKALVLVISFVATAGLPVPQNNDSTRPEASWDYSSQTANQAADKTELTKEADRTWKSSLESSDLYGDLYAHDVSQSQGSLTGDLRRKLSLESQRLSARLAQELRELRERLAAAFAAHPTASLPPQRAPAAARDRLALPTHRLRDALDSDARELCSALRRYAQGPETGGGPAPEPGATRYEDAARGMGRALGASERELTARLAEFQAEASGATGGQGGAAAALRAEVEAFGAGVRSRAESLRTGLAGTQSLGEGLSKHVEQFCRSSEEENRRFAGRIERQLEALGQGERGALSEGLGEAPFVSPSSTGSLGEDFSPKLNALLQDILQTLS